MNEAFAKCGQSSRRSFLRGATLGSVGLSLGGTGFLGAEEEIARAGSFRAEEPRAELLVRELMGSLTGAQREKVVLAFDDPLRQRIENNWNIVPHRIGQVFDVEQQLLLRDIFWELHSEEMREEVWRQFQEDNRGGGARTPDEIFGRASVAIFEDAAGGSFEWVLTARHTTRRCDGNATRGVAFGGPIFYGHASGSFYEKPDHPGNAYWFQALRANEVFAMLDGKQREKALKDHSRGERGTATVALRGEPEGIEGLPSWEMTSDQRLALRRVINDLLKPFRDEDREEALAMIDAQLPDTHIAFYRKEDVGDDQVWDTWQLEGPGMVWYFRGDPHVHTWVHVKQPDEV